MIFDYFFGGFLIKDKRKQKKSCNLVNDRKLHPLETNRWLNVCLINLFKTWKEKPKNWTKILNLSCKLESKKSFAKRIKKLINIYLQTSFCNHKTQFFIVGVDFILKNSNHLMKFKYKMDISKASLIQLNRFPRTLLIFYCV